MKKKDFKIDHSGEHHLAKITSEKGVLGGKISNFGERGVATLLLRKGKVSGEISHSSDNHAASFLLKPDGTWSFLANLLCSHPFSSLSLLRACPKVSVGYLDLVKVIHKDS